MWYLQVDKTDRNTSATTQFQMEVETAHMVSLVAFRSFIPFAIRFSLLQTRKKKQRSRDF
jgi:hypothetical protein